jgi:superfamily II DNA or RNA helicase
MAKFGITPWGAWFAEALEGYDESGRLSRGKSYANTGKVKELSIKDGIATAKVAGHSRPWYTVTVRFKPLGKTESESLSAIFREDPLLLSRVEAGELPGELVDKLKRGGIDLIPRRWKDMHRECSCPDWGDPCKHMAAVYYLLAKEIDQDPRILFALRGIDLGALAVPGAATRIASTEDLEQPLPDPFTWRLETEGEDEFILLPEGRDYPFLAAGENYTGLISALLPKETAFADGNFAAALIAVYHEAARRTCDHVSEADERVERRCSSAHYRLAALDSPLIVASYPSGESRSMRLPEVAGLFLGFSSDAGTEEYRYLFHFFRLIEDLWRAGAFVPAPRLAEGLLSVAWRPLSYLREVKALMTSYAELFPPGLAPVAKGPRPSRASLAEYLAASCLTQWVRSLASEMPAERSGLEEACGLFFRGEFVDVSKPGKRSMPRALAAWLAPLSIDFSRCAFRFTLGYKAAAGSKADTGDGAFSLSLDYVPRGDGLAAALKPIPLKDAAASPGGKTALRNAAVLRAYLPELDTLASKKSVRLEEARLVAFLSEAGPVLRRMGAEIILPKALHRELKPRPAIKVETKGAGALNSYLGLDALLSYERGVAIGERILSTKEFEDLVGEKRQIVVFKDGFVRLDPVEAARLLEGAKSRSPLDALDLVRAHLAGDAVFSADAEELATSLFRELAVPVPSSLNAKLRPYQERGYRWAYSNLMNGFGCVLADDMGLGKTVQAIAVMLRLREEGLAGMGALVVAPAALLTNWERELARFAPSLTVARYHGAKRALRDIDGVTITTYATAVRDAAALSARGFSLLVADEAHLLKNAATKQSRTLKDMSARYKLALSGTPVENKLEDLRSLFDLVLPGYLGGPAEFKKTYRVPIEVERDPAIADRLKRITSPFLMRRLKTDPDIASELPDKTVIDEFAGLAKEQAALYESIVRKALEETRDTSDRFVRRALVLKLITGLKQVCDHPRVYDKESPMKAALSGKALLLVELLAQILERREKVLVFSQYVECLDVLKRIIADELGEDCLLYTGRMGQSARVEAVETFQKDGGRRIMLVSLKAGGVGLNLTAASRVIHYDLWFNPAVENQATDRAFRIGQTRNVFVHRFITAGSFEEKIDEMLKSKRELAELSVASGESWLSKMNDDELRDIFSEKQY